MDMNIILSDNRSSQANIGLSPEEFYKLLPFFDVEIQRSKRKRKKKNKKNAGRKSKLNTSEKKMYYALYYLKTYPTFDVLGGIFGMDRGTACKWAHRYVDTLLEALVKADVIPKTKIKSREEFIEFFPELKIVITDGTERRKRRPKNKDEQRKYYSGKKKCHTIKNVCIGDKNKRIIYVSKTYPGKEHDKTIFLNEKLYNFLPDYIKALFDLGFEGLEKDCPDMKNIIKPTKRKKGQKELSKTVAKKNRKISSKRVVIENAFAGVKRLKVTWDIFRNRKKKFCDKVFWIACGIWNFHLAM